MNQTDHILKIASGIGVLDTLDRRGISVASFAKTAAYHRHPVLTALADDMAYALEAAERDGATTTKVAQVINYKYANAAAEGAEEAAAAAPGMIRRGINAVKGLGYSIAENNPAAGLAAGVGRIQGGLSGARDDLAAGMDIGRFRRAGNGIQMPSTPQDTGLLMVGADGVVPADPLGDNRVRRLGAFLGANPRSSAAAMMGVPAAGLAAAGGVGYGGYQYANRDR